MSPIFEKKKAGEKWIEVEKKFRIDIKIILIRYSDKSTCANHGEFTLIKEWRALEQMNGKT